MERPRNLAGTLAGPEGHELADPLGSALQHKALKKTDHLSQAQIMRIRTGTVSHNYTPS